MIPLFMAHNRQTLAFAAGAIGQSKMSLDHVQKMFKLIPKKFAEMMPHFADLFAAGPYEFFVRVGAWEQMLALPPPENLSLHLAVTFYHACRAVSFAALKQSADARKEQKLALQELPKVTPSQKYIANTAQGYLDTLKPFMEGEILISENKREEAVVKLQEACGYLDKLMYEHPPMFVVSPRHPLGALLIELGRAEEAVEVYKADLKQWPQNGWGLKGLQKSYEKLGKKDLAQKYEKEFAAVWSDADIVTESSCCCLPQKSSA
jgi:tetratricopeptide (TPR) repeat protein